jgi:hypothetical protein
MGGRNEAVWERASGDASRRVFRSGRVGGGRRSRCGRAGSGGRALADARGDRGLPDRRFRLRPWLRLPLPPRAAAPDGALSRRGVKTPAATAPRLRTPPPPRRNPRRAAGRRAARRPKALQLPARRHGRGARGAGPRRDAADPVTDHAELARDEACAEADGEAPRRHHPEAGPLEVPLHPVERELAVRRLAGEEQAGVLEPPEPPDEAPGLAARCTGHVWLEAGHVEPAAAMRPETGEDLVLRVGREGFDRTDQVIREDHVETLPEEEAGIAPVADYERMARPERDGVADLTRHTLRAGDANHTLGVEPRKPTHGVHASARIEDGAPASGCVRLGNEVEDHRHAAAPCADRQGGRQSGKRVIACGPTSSYRDQKTRRHRIGRDGTAQHTRPVEAPGGDRTTATGMSQCGIQPWTNDR